jgi:hypothetical protein
VVTLTCKGVMEEEEEEEEEFIQNRSRVRRET